MTLAARVLTVSDGVAAGEREDASGPALVARLEAEAEQLPRKEIILASLQNRAAIIVTRTMDEAIELTNLLAPEQVVVIHRDDVHEAIPSQVSAMPTGLVNVLTRDEVVALVSFLEAGDDLPTTLKHQPGHGGAGVSPPK